MTDRINSLTVILDKEWRVDEAQSLMEAICHMRGVIEVKPGSAETTYVIRSQLALEMRRQLFKALETD